MDRSAAGDPVPVSGSHVRDSRDCLCGKKVMYREHTQTQRKKHGLLFVEVGEKLFWVFFCLFVCTQRFYTELPPQESTHTEDTERKIMRKEKGGIKTCVWELNGCSSVNAASALFDR